MQSEEKTTLKVTFGLVMFETLFLLSELKIEEI